MTVKLFGKNKKAEQNEAVEKEAISIAPVMIPEDESPKLVLDIEGLSRETPPDQPLNLKTETDSLPNQQELMLQSLQDALQEEHEEQKQQKPDFSGFMEMDLFHDDAEAEPKTPVTDEALEAAIKSVQDSVHGESEKPEPSDSEAEPAPDTDSTAEEVQPLPTEELSEAPAAESAEEPAQPEPAQELTLSVEEGTEQAEPEKDEQSEPEQGEQSGAEEAEAGDSEEASQPQDEESFLEELYALIGKPVSGGEQPAPVTIPEAIETRSEQSRESRSAVRITPEQIEQIQQTMEELPEDEEGGVPGWLKGALLLLISLLLSAMTFYAVASDVIGEIF